MARRGGNMAISSRNVTEVSAPRTAMRRILDEVVDCPVGGAVRGSVSVHVRIWDGGDQDDPGRLVVLLGALRDSTGLSAFLEEMVRHLDRTVLHGRASEAVWCLYYPEAFGALPAHSVNPVVLHFAPHYDRPGDRPVIRPFWRRWLTELQKRYAAGPDLRPESPRPWMRWPEVERIVGAAVECYPPVAYTRETVTRTRAEPHRVHEVTHDPIYSRALLDALAFFDAIPAEHDFAATATRSCTMLADAVRERWRLLNLDHWDDGTQPRGHDAATWPQVFAARLVPPELTADEIALLQRYSDQFDISTAPEPWARLRRLLGQLRLWREDTAPDTDDPDDSAHAATSTADNLLSTYMRTASPEFAADDHPDSRLRVFEVVGECDRRYLDSVDWDREPDESNVRYRRLRQHFSSTEQPLVQFGTDQWHHLVAYSPGPPDWPRVPASCCMEWPLRPPAEPVTAACLIVADGKSGDRPVYLEYPDGRLAPLPDRPEHHHSGWNFGYSGGGPGALEDAIISLFTRTDQLDRQDFPIRWVQEQVAHSPLDRLVISVAEIHERLPHR